mmetsp:Transcript_31626/g.38698  ORF Transcript_31626/g.38698 Transcript_31626/m.38698 type:complete len:148 (+) Transcript_31626:354-797(+)
MVAHMSDVYSTLAPEAREAVIILPVGVNPLRYSDNAFCWREFGMCHDSQNDPWWSAWKAEQRDVFFFLRSGEMGSWEYVCKISMNRHKEEFEGIIHDLLRVDTNSTSNMTDFTQANIRSSSSSLQKPPLTTTAAVIGSLLGIWFLQI